MKRKFYSVKLRLILITVTFSLFTTIVLGLISFFILQRYVKENLIQSTKFNLHFIAGNCNQDAILINSLVTWCGYNTLVSQWSNSAFVDNQLAMKVYERIREEFQNNTANQYIRRMILCDNKNIHILQIGNKTADSKPITPFLISNYSKNMQETKSWGTIMDDPFDFLEAKNTIPIIQPIYSMYSREVFGTSYVFVDISFILDKFKNYEFSNKAPLFVNVGESLFKLSRNDKNIVYLEETNKTPVKTKNTIFVKVENFPISFEQDVTGLLRSQKLKIIPYLIILIIIGTCLLASILISLLDKVITQPLSKINLQLKKVAKGDFLPNEEIEWENEIGDVGRGINSLAQNVQNLMKSKVEEEKNKRLLEYRMLQNQVNPHFLYNTLNSIKWMATIQRTTGIAEMITSLARLLKNVSKASGTLTTLSRELELLDDYFVIQQYRYGGSVTFEKSIAENILQTPIPCFTLQPLLENAIFHGIEPTGQAGKITLEGFEENNRTKLILTDNGKGMSEETIRKIFNDTTSSSTGLFKNVGLLNVHKRIQYEFGNSFGLSIVSEMDKYTSITIELPAAENE